MIKSNFITLIFSDAFSALLAVVTKYFFSFKYFFTKDLIKLEIVRFEKDEQDTRIKHVYLNDKGKKIFNEIFEIQKKRIYNALLNSSSEEVINFDNVLKKIIDE